MKWNIGWGCVSACNMKCEFCYSKNKRILENDISYPEWINFIDKNAEYISTINYGTGENSLSDDWFRLIEYIRNNYPNIRQALTTNGHIYNAISNDDKKKNSFLKSIDEVDVSLDFADKDMHNSFRGQRNAYDWALNTLRLCNKNNIPVTIVVLGSEKTLYEDNVDGLFEIAKENNAIVRVNIYRPTNGIDDNSKKYILSTERLLCFLNHVNEKYKVLSINDSLLAPILVGKSSLDPSGKNSIRILPNGSITPSTYLITDNFIIGNISDDINLGHLENSDFLKEKMVNKIPVECNKCKYVRKCGGGVLDRRYLWNGTLKKKDPYCFIDNKKLMKQFNFHIDLENVDFKSVHDGYLPTMFFKY